MLIVLLCVQRWRINLAKKITREEEQGAFFQMPR
jgi:hypothetical protein